MDNKVSVVVTCFNHEKYIEQCLDSIYNQTYKNIELLVINDGSTDESHNIIRKVIAKSPFARTEYRSQINSGICVTRNSAFNWIEGSFLLFVDSDNYLESTYIDKLMQAAFQTNADILYGNLFDPDSKRMFMESRPFVLDDYLVGNYIDNCSLLRVAGIGKARYDLELNRKKLVDYDFMLNLIVNESANPYYVSEANVNYRVLESSISNRRDEHFYFEVYFYIMKKYLKLMPENVYRGAQANVFLLEGRLSELLEHLSKVTDYVHDLESVRLDLTEKLKQETAQISSLTQEKQLLEAEIGELSKHNIEIQQKNQFLQQENQLILASKSYQIGNAIIRPLKFVGQIVKHPRLIRTYLGKAKRKVQGTLSVSTSLKGRVLRLARSVQRKKNNYQDPKRVLVYVIYEGQAHLQEYKIIFLKALAELSDKVLIVVNGSLPEEDIKTLKNYGEVQLRDNSGYDTAAFRYGIQYLGEEQLRKFDELLLVNDTNVGPVSDLKAAFDKMATRKLDFWGISYGDPQPDFTQYNPYHYIPEHLQSYFLVIERSLLQNNSFYDYWAKLEDTDSRNKAIGKHETVFTKYFADKGFIHGSLASTNEDSAMYIHPLTMVKDGVPLVKYTAFANYDNDKFAWQGLLRETEVPALLTYLENETSYPMQVIYDIMDEVKNKKVKEHILIIDGVENAIPQCTRYRVLNKAEQLRSLGHEVWVVNRSGFQMGYAEHASHIIIYRCAYSNELSELCRLAKKYNKTVLFDIDDLVIDTKYTNQLSYTQSLSRDEKLKYDAGVNSYGQMMCLCDGIITSTGTMQKELKNYKDLVLLNRNLASAELIAASDKAIEEIKQDSALVKIGYFSGSITHNENFELIKPALIKLLKAYPNVELHLVGYLDLPDELSLFKAQIKQHDYVEWHELPRLIRQVDINLAPLVNSIFNQAKSEIKWIEAALVKVPTIASNIGSFNETIINDVNGILATDDSWFEALESLILSSEKRISIANNAYSAVVNQHSTYKHIDQFSTFLENKED